MNPGAQISDQDHSINKTKKMVAIKSCKKKKWEKFPEMKDMGFKLENNHLLAVATLF